MLQKQCQLLHNQEMAPLQGCHVYASYPPRCDARRHLNVGGTIAPFSSRMCYRILQHILKTVISGEAPQGLRYSGVLR